MYSGLGHQDKNGYLITEKANILPHHEGDVKQDKNIFFYQAIIYLQLKKLFINSTNIYRVPTIYKASRSVFFWSLQLEKDVVVLKYV